MFPLCHIEPTYQNYVQYKDKEGGKIMGQKLSPVD